MKKGRYGLVYQEVTRNSNIPAAAKGLYAYLSAFCGVSDECYPGVETITREMGMGKDTFYRHINALVAAGVVKKQQAIGENGKFGRTLYRLTHEVGIHDFPFPQNRDTDKPDTVAKETIINSNKINNKKNNSNNISPESEISDPVPSGICILLSDKSIFDVPAASIEKWREAYPAVDVEQELRKMSAWSEANPTKRKTPKGINRFIVNWLARQQDAGGSRGNWQQAGEYGGGVKGEAHEDEYKKKQCEAYGEY